MHYVRLHVLCGVKEEAECVRRQLHPPDSMHLEKSLRCHKKGTDVESLDLPIGCKGFLRQGLPDPRRSAQEIMQSIRYAELRRQKPA